MPRCSLTDKASRRPLLRLAALSLLSGLLLSSVSAYAARILPPNSLRGVLQVDVPPDALLNGLSAPMAPGVRIRGSDNLLILSGAISGFKGKVNYRLENTTGLLQDIWLLTDEEADQRWPTTLEEAATWVYDPITHTWSKP